MIRRHFKFLKALLLIPHNELNQRLSAKKHFKKHGWTGITKIRTKYNQLIKKIRLNKEHQTTLAEIHLVYKIIYILLIPATMLGLTPIPLITLTLIQILTWYTLAECPLRSLHGDEK